MLKIYFWYLYWFQIFENLWSVPSISVAVLGLRDTMNNILVQDTVSRIPNFESKVIPIPQKIRTYLGLDGLFFGVSLRDTMKNILVQDTNSNPMCNFPTSIDLKLLLDLYHSYYFQPLN